MKRILTISSIISLFVIIGCEPKVTGPEEPTETYIGYAVGDSGKIYKSVDGGKNWEKKQSGITTKLNSVYVFNDTKVIAVGDNGVIIKTTDGGNTWVNQSSGTTVNLTKIIYNSLTNQSWISGNEGVLLTSNNF